MKKKIIGVFLFVLTIIGIFCGIEKVNAQTYNGKIIPGNWISGYWIDKKDGNSVKYEQARFINRTEDGAFAYCLQPFITIVDGSTYNVTNEDFLEVAEMSQEQWERVSRLAYYGYGYTDDGYNHLEDKWYVATQFLIWKTVAPDHDIWFTNGLNGSRNNNVLVDEMNEINSLVNNHTTKPNINLPSETVIGNTISATDENGVLDKFTISSVEGGGATKNGNTLYLTPNEVGNMKISLTKYNDRYREPIYLYFATNSQNVFRRGNLDPTNQTYNIKVFGGKVTIVKEDKETKESQGEGTLFGAVYGIYDEEGKLIQKISTGNNGKITSDYLPKLGNFYLQEITPSTGYTLDNTKYNFTLTKDNLNPEIIVKEQVIKERFKYTKVIAQNNTGIMKPEANVDFGIYNIKNEEVFKVTTDVNGELDFELPYGTYTMKQLTRTYGTEMIGDIKLEVKENGKLTTRVLANGKIVAKLHVVKIDSETKEVIKRSGIKFKIYDEENKKYVCQTTSYPKATICEYETDKDGEFITPFVLDSGTYRLEEVDQSIDGYLWNKESHEFTIGENSELKTDSEYGVIFDVNFENTPVKGEVELEKVGETIELEEGKGYKYNKEPLKDIIFGLYDQDNNKVSEGKTDEKGNLIFSNLKLGKYCIKELKTLDGYVLNETPICFELKYKDQYTPVISYKTLVINKVKTGELEFTKTDLSESKTLPNTTIEIYTEDNKLVYTGKTDNQGKIVIDRLPIGKYYILEKEAPKGYNLNSEKMPFEILENGQVVKAIMKDEKIIEVPNTEKTEFPILELSSVLLCSIGLGIIIYVKKRKNK